MFAIQGFTENFLGKVSTSEMVLHFISSHSFTLRCQSCQPILSSNDVSLKSIPCIYVCLAFLNSAPLTKGALSPGTSCKEVRLIGEPSSTSISHCSSPANPCL